MLKSYVKMAEVEVQRHHYDRSRIQFAKALELGYLNDETKKIT
jgi:hypothetical protein